MLEGNGTNIHIRHQIYITQAVNVDKICAVLPKVASERCPDMEEQAQAVANKHGRALLLFSKCHNSLICHSTLTMQPFLLYVRNKITSA